MIHITSTDTNGDTREVKTLTSDNGDQINHHADTGAWDAWHTLDERQVNDLTANTAANAALHVYAFSKVDARSGRIGRWHDGRPSGLLDRRRVSSAAC